MNQIMEQTQSVVVGALIAIGAVVVLLYCENTLSFVYSHFFRPAKNLKKKYGTWAVVTGATDGIGRYVYCSNSSSSRCCK